MRVAIVVCALAGCGDNQRATIDAAAPDATIDAAIDGPSAGVLRGTFELSFYWLSTEADFSGTPDTELYDDACNVLATVPYQFAQALRLEGTGKLLDGRTLNVSGSCSCPNATTCYSVLSAQYPWGIGVMSRPLVPFVSIAVDRNVIAFGTTVWIAELEGLALPDGSGAHTGCVVADDTGGGIAGMQLEWFVATKPYQTALASVVPTTITVYEPGGKCL